MATYNYTVTASGNSYYLWNGHGLVDAQNPDLFFRAGDSITITNASGGHPMRISNDISPSVGPIDESGGQIYVSSAVEGAFTYVCTSHPSAMIGAITVSRAYANEGPEDGYGTGPLIGHDAGPLSMNEIRTKINEIITKGGIGGGGGSISVSENAPPSPSDGDLWWDSDTASLYVYFADRSAWIQTNGAVGGGGGMFDSGWLEIPNYAAGSNNQYADLPISHMLGNKYPIVQVYIQDVSTGLEQNIGMQIDEWMVADDSGVIYNPIDSNTGTIRIFEKILGESATEDGELNYLDIVGNTAYRIKVVASAGGGGGGASGGGDASIEVSDTAPDPAEDGDLWFNTTQAELYVYVDAENAWIQTNGGGGGGGIGDVIESQEFQFTANTQYDTSTNQYSVRNGPYPRWEHGLGQVPKFYSMSLRCKVAEEGWNVGDEFFVGYNGVYSRGEYAVWADSTYVGFIFKSDTTNNPFTVGKKEQSGNNPANITSNSFLPDPAKWKIVFRASSGSGGSGPRAYVAFDGTTSATTPTIYNSFNVSSVTDKGSAAGSSVWWNVNLTTPVANPIVQFSVDSLYNGTTNFNAVHHGYHIVDDSTITFHIYNYSGGGVPDSSFNHWSVVIF